MFDEIFQQAKSLNQRCKHAARQLKDRLIPWRKKRREQMLHLGQQIELLHAQLAQTQQSLAASQQSLAGLENRQLSNRQWQALNELVQQSPSPAIQRLVAESTEKLAAHINQVERDQEAAFQQLGQRWEAVQQRLNQVEQGAVDRALLAQRMESRLLELEQQTNLLREASHLNEPLVNSLQSRIAGLEQHQTAAELHLNEIGSQLQQLASTDLPQPVESQSQPIAALQPLPGGEGWPEFAAKKTCSEVLSESPAKRTLKPSRFGSAAYDYYAQLKDSPFVYLDVKSVPRSGLHYLQRTLKDILGKSLSFCEWYQEPGCCRQMPCALTGFAQACCQQQTGGVRMVKSHDFDLADPIFPSSASLRRIVLIREPIFCLTSYWNLQSLKHNQELLAAHGIHPVKVDYLHEPPVLQMAYQLIDSSGSVPEEAILDQWLESTKKYMLGFITKWGRHVPAESVIAYENVNEFALELVEGIAEKLSPLAVERLQTWKQQRNQHFASRSSPFQSGSQRLSAYLVQHAQRFQQCAEEIKEADPTGWFSRCGHGPSKDSPISVDGCSPLRVAG